MAAILDFLVWNLSWVILVWDITFCFIFMVQSFCIFLVLIKYYKIQNGRLMAILKLFDPKS